MSPLVDAVVVGAGPAGCAAATRLAEAGHSVTLLEREPATGNLDRTSGEVVAPGTQAELGMLGVEPAGPWVLDDFTAVRNVFPDGTWIGIPLPAGLRFIHVDRAGMESAQRAPARATGVELRHEVRVTDVCFAADRAVVRSACGSEFAGRVLLDAGGRASPTLRKLGLRQEEPEVRQIAVALFFESFDGAPLHTWDRHFYGEHGAMISGARIEPGRWRYVLEADWADKEASGQQPVAFFEEIARRFDPWIASRLAVEPRLGRAWSMAPLGDRAASLVGDRFLLLGDAAGYLSPITGQGIEFALRSARLAAGVVSKALSSGDLSASSFSSYVDGHAEEVATQVAVLRAFLLQLRDRDLLLRAAHDDDALRQLLGPLADLPGQERGSL